MENKLLNILMDINPDLDYENATDLVSGKQLDSLQVLSLVVALEEEMHIPIDPAEVTADNFDSYKSIEKLIAKHING